MTLYNKIKTAKDNLVYSFIPVKAHEDSDYVNIAEFNKILKGDEELYSGSINCSLYALNHLIVGNLTKKENEDQENEYTVINPLEMNNKILISPHTLKGAVASFVKQYLNVPIRKINQQSFMMRPNINIYTKLHDNKDNKRLITGAGIITKVLKDSMEILPIDGLLKFEDSSLKNISLNPLLNSFNEKDIEKLHETNIKIGNSKTAYYFFSYPDGWVGNGLTVDKFLEHDKENNSKLKHHNCIGFNKKKFTDAIKFGDHLKLKVNQDILDHYHKTIDELGSGFVNKHPFHFNEDEKKEIKENIEKMRIFKVGEPIIFQYDAEQDQIISFGKNFYYLWLYQNSLEDIVKNNLKDEFFKTINDEIRISRFYEMFGFTKEDMLKHENHKDKVQNSKAGKIHINYAQYISGGSIDRNGFNLKRPGQPMPSAYEFYLKQEESDNEEKPLITYGDRAREDHDKAVLSGRKVYKRSSKNYLPISLTDEDQKMMICLKKVVRPHNIKNNLDSFPEFKFKLHFNNLTQDELSLLCFSLQLDDKKKNDLFTQYENENILCHQIGYGKNYGLGAVKIFIDQMIVLDSKLNQKSFNPLDFINAHSFENKSELKDSFKLKTKEFSYPQRDGEIPKWHSEIRADDFKLRSGSSEKSLVSNKPKPKNKPSQNQRRF